MLTHWITGSDAPVSSESRVSATATTVTSSGIITVPAITVNTTVSACRSVARTGVASRDVEVIPQAFKLKIT